MSLLNERCDIWEVFDQYLNEHPNIKEVYSERWTVYSSDDGTSVCMTDEQFKQYKKELKNGSIK